MKTAFLFFLSIVTSFSYGQNLFDTKFKKCDASAFFLEGNEIFAQKDLVELSSEILSKIEPSQLLVISGEIKIQVFIDSLGNACCVSLENNLNKKGKKIDFASIIDNHTTWTSPIRKGQIASVCTIISLDFLEDKIIVQRQGYNRKLGGIIVLDSTELKR